MIVQCADCKTSFRLRADLVPPRRIQVRCSRCGSVFAIDGRNAGTPEPVASATPPPSQYNDIGLDKPALAARPEAPSSPAPGSGRAPSMDFEIERTHAPVQAQPQAAGAVAVEAPPEKSRAGFRELDLDAKPEQAPAAAAVTDPEVKKKQDKARRLARALVSDILVYNRERRDAALQGGNLVQVLGPEIKKSWEVYKERVTPDVANDSDYFRDALNEILADGQPIF